MWDPLAVRVSVLASGLEAGRGLWPAAFAIEKPFSPDSNRRSISQLSKAILQTDAPKKAT
jgi:hypothetical protein